MSLAAASQPGGGHVLVPVHGFLVLEAPCAKLYVIWSKYGTRDDALPTLATSAFTSAHSVRVQGVQPMLNYGYPA
jgi:hypothetical protein